MASTITINGNTYSGREIVVKGNNNIVIDGVRVAVPGDDSSGSDVYITGNIERLEVHNGSATVDGVTGAVSAGGSVRCGNVGGNVKAGGSVRCDDVFGTIRAGGSVRSG